MGLRAQLPALAIEPFVVDGLMAYYFAGLQGASADAAKALADRLGEAFLADAQEAACDAIILSTLAGTLEADADFLALLAEQAPLADPFHEEMRRTLFAAGIESAKLTVKQHAPTHALLIHRSAMFVAHAAR